MAKRAVSVLPRLVARDVRIAAADGSIGVGDAIGRFVAEKNGSLAPVGTPPPEIVAPRTPAVTAFALLPAITLAVIGVPPNNSALGSIRRLCTLRCAQHQRLRIGGAEEVGCRIAARITDRCSSRRR